MLAEDDMSKVEVSVRDFGSMVFGEMTETRYDIGHWAKIKPQAKPHVDALLALADEMGYFIIGLPGADGKPLKTKQERMDAAQEAVWGTTLDKLNVGDQFWPTTELFECSEAYPTESDPYVVDNIDAKKGVMYVQIGRDRIEKIEIDDKEVVIKAPDDFDEELHQWEPGRKFWLQKADELGIK
jgi:hypothetical protein